ncbi:MAG: enoyl-CoA hydratase, partial [Tepidimonas sp.]|nr:enoyl-CoA hydratase [Tepidimonas sp.]
MTALDAEPILLHARDPRGVHTLTLNTPKAFNALSEPMLEALSAKLDEIAADD